MKVTERTVDRRYAFNEHPCGLVQIEDFLDCNLAAAARSYLDRCEGRFREAFGIYSREGDCGAEAWSRAAASDRFFRYTSLADFPFDEQEDERAFFRVRNYLMGDGLRQLVSNLTGLDLGPPTMPAVHAFRAGDFLWRHTDRGHARRIAWVLHLSRDWPEERGGVLRISDSGGGEWRVPPGWNRFILFDVPRQREHLVTPVIERAGRERRLTLSGWVTHA